MGARERALLSTCTTACCWPQCGAMPPICELYRDETSLCWGALIVPAGASTFHQPRKGSLDDPLAGKHYEPVQLVALDDLDDDDASRITAPPTRSRVLSSHAAAPGVCAV